jgi:DNA mismatch repair protein MutL
MTVASSPGKIKILPDDVISRIAAGEVIERPSSVVKELIENSLDAGARLIRVAVADAGRTSIRVTDDGEGMTRSDAQAAFQRHATSKLRSDADLIRLGTMGFRGEALPSIAAVARVRVATACPDDALGTGIWIDAGRIERIEDVPAVRGTDLEISDLFFNTPARRKFLKSPATEFSHICLAVQHAALAHPGIHVRLAHNGETVFDYPAVRGLRDRILQVYGAGLVEELVEVDERRPGLRVSGYTVRASNARTGRSPQELFVNRRPVKNAAALHAIYDGYGPALAKGRHPVFVLALEVDPERVDVNVHPAKREVRFAEQDAIHQLVRHAVRRAVGHEPAAAVAGGFIAAPQISPVQQAVPLPFQGAMATAAAMPRAAGGPPRVEEAAAEAYTAGGSDVLTVTAFGQLHQTFMLAQVGTELQIVDQHTAHERVLFERLWYRWQSRSIETQPLLIPQPVEIPPSQAALLRQHLEELAALGLELEPFGANAYVLRATPAVLGPLDGAGLVQDLLEDLSQWSSAGSLEGRVRALFASMACHAAVRAGRLMQLPEMKQLIEDWVRAGMPTTCPHGRRVALRLPADELAKMFRRES